MRSRDEVLREFGRKDCVDNTGRRVEWLGKPWVQITDAMADRIRELEAQLSAVVARETQRESGKSILRGIAAPEVYRG